MSWRRRHCLAAAAAAPLAACLPEAQARCRWVGADHARGHRLRAGRAGSLPAPAVQRRAQVLVVGGGVAGLSALRALVQAGVADAQLLELEDSPGGNSRGHRLAGLPCPLGAHYLPVPGAAAREVSAWLHDIGLLRSDAAGVHANERHLCHAPQERLFIDGAWQEGLLPSADGRPATLAQYHRFADRVRSAQRQLGFAMPSHHAPWTPAHQALDTQRFATWLAREGLHDGRLLGYLDYACRDDYGAGLDSVSAWAGLHYFASRHGFERPGEEAGPGSEPDGVFTWPEGNAWLVGELATPLAGRLHAGRTVLRVAEGRHAVELLAWDEQQARAEAWTADAVVMATPLFVARHLLDGLAPGLQQALSEAVQATQHAPWLVANLHLAAPLLDRPGAAPAWDNVRFQPAGQGTALGYVDARHQSLRPDVASQGPVLLTAYHALPAARREWLLRATPQQGLAEVLAALAPVHPDLAGKLQQADLMRWGHAMAIPAPGVRSQPARQALRQARGRVRFAHSDLAGYSVFEEAFTLGVEAVAGLGL